MTIEEHRRPAAASADGLAALPAWARELLRETRVGRLGLVDDDGAPRVLPVTFAVAEGAVWSVVDHKPKRPGEPARVHWLRERPQVALCVDVYDDDWSRLAWVQLLGPVEVLALADGDAGLAALSERYPAYRERRPPGPLLRLEPERILHWRAAEGS
ncbi:MAG TPA: pyridoxamine 5'-phosphate oxidase family protein [Thermoleophilaceae bacterium]|nr:pyridoxamine 5'-phosphate oxidase family protein [Thermoleophilaceae bacterium]